MKKTTKDLKDFLINFVAREKDIDQRIFLTGFMGAGKSAVGKLLAENLDLPYCDLDEEVERKAGKSINEIFDLEGEAYFRMLETDTLEQVIRDKSRCVVSTGGGIVLNKHNRDLMKQSGIIFYLRAKIDTIIERLEGDEKRPLLKDDDKREQALQIFSQRSSLYEESDYTVDTDGLDPGQIAERIEQIATGHISDSL